MVRIPVVLISLLVCGGWNYVEHVELGSESYIRACEHLQAELAGAEIAVQTRLDIACDNLEISAQLYGQATALAGDRFSAPADFLATNAGWKAASRKQYYSLALANSTHFHPYAPREWRRYHASAIDRAIAASKAEGLDAVDGLQLALFDSAFADHFLHDSFSSGHMGFNRGASSVAASLAYHDEWNRKGRVVRDRAGRSWTTYGDGRLDAKENDAGKTHAIDVAALSTEMVLRAFVTGLKDSDAELEVWRALPFVIEAPETLSLTDRILGESGDGDSLHPLGAINWPARKDRVVDLRTLVTAPLEGRTPAVTILLGYQVSLPLVGTRAHVGVGATIPHGDRAFHFAGDIAFAAELGLTNDGILDHQLAGGALWEADPDEPAGAVWGGYHVNIEVGRSVIQVEVGPAFVFPEREIGFAASIGFARVLSAAGGGVR
jgi:hypothetical protein